jgi:hypothetical protein
MFGATYTTPEAMAYRAAMMAHYVKCDECGGNVCGDYIAGRHSCHYAHEDCFGGGKFDDGVFCHYCR